MSDFYENRTPNPNEPEADGRPEETAAENNSAEAAAQEAAPEFGQTAEKTEDAAPAADSEAAEATGEAEAPRTAQTAGDPNKTVGSNAGWQQNPYYSQYNPRTGWSNGPQAGQSGRNAYGASSYGSNYSGYSQFTGTGFRQPGQRQPGADQYKWNFADYDNQPPKKPGKKKHRGVMVFTAIACSALIITMVGFAGYGVWNLIDGRAEAPQSSQAGSQPESNLPGININDIPEGSDPVAADGSLTTRQIAAKVQPSVVGVVVYTNSMGNMFYGNGSAIVTQEGSGIIMSSDGYIITNAHVVSGATGMKVVLYNGEEYDARLVGSDDSTDLAVIKIEANNLTPAEFGDSNQLEVGEDVVAIGNPGGLELASSVTKGIISGVNRPIKNSDGGYTMNCIQTDAAINPGNSGGALVNEYGQVVGINSSKIASTEYEGLGFAIPISEAKPIIDDLIANGRVTGRVKLGITTNLVIDETLARYNNVPTGIMVASTDVGSDIANKGVIAGDIISKIDGNSITSLGDLRDYLKKFKPGDKVTLTVFRRTSGKPDTTFEVTIALMEDTGDDGAATQQAVPGQQGQQQEQGGGRYYNFPFFR